MKFISKIKTFEYKTKKRLDFITITSDIEDFIKESYIKDGLVVIQTHHTTCSIWVNENEKNLIGENGDIQKVLDKIANPNIEYGHNDIKDSNNPNGKRDTHLCDADSCGVISECKNGHAHAQGMILPCSISLIIKDGKLIRGKWQEILLVELDHDRERKIGVLVQGSKD
jgi:secondary thiamine-phosphate synthase enzyme|tara:strand:- start:429 stop:935 length:507 start_codon:yes stop_codon:yes gene_type:complete